MRKNIYLIFMAVMLFFVACSPIEDRMDMGPLLTESQLDITVTVVGNTAKCVNNTPGTIAYWDWQIGHSNQPKVDIYLPLKGTYKLTFTAYCGGGKVSKTQDIVIAQNDPEYYKSPLWNKLTNGATGKTWVWASDIPGGKVWGIGPYKVPNDAGWWTLTTADIVGQGGGLDDELYFDLDKAHHVKVTAKNPDHKAAPASGAGFFTMDIADKDVLYTDDSKATKWAEGVLTFVGQAAPMAFQPNAAGKPLQYKYDIVKLTDDELWLFYPEPGVTAQWGAAWFCKFKRKGYTY